MVFGTETDRNSDTINQNLNVFYPLNFDLKTHPKGVPRDWTKTWVKSESELCNLSWEATIYCFEKLTNLLKQSVFIFQDFTI